MSVPALNGERSIGELFGELASETSTLIRQEVNLATVELTQKAAYAGRQAAMVGGGALVGMLAVQALAAAGIIALASVNPLWAAALAVGGLLLVVALAVAMTGLTALKHMDLTPTQTLQSLKDNKTWMRRELH